MKALGSILGGMLLLAVSAAHAADLQKGAAAYARGDYAAAIAEFRPLAEQGNARAQSDLGDMYANGQGGVPRDLHQAISWYRSAAEKGDAKGQVTLGGWYETGVAVSGVSQDSAQAVAWYRKAAEQGNAEGQQMLGAAYRYGRGVPQDYAQAIAWVRKSAAQGAYGQLALAWMYHDGIGMQKNIIAAYALVNFSAAAIDFSTAQVSPGMHMGSTDRNELMEEMTPAQIDAGQALTREMQRVGVLQALDAR